MKYRDRHGAIKETKTYYADVWHGNQRERVALRTENKTEATTKVRELVGQGGPLHRGARRLSDLLELVRADYAREKYVCAPDLERRIRHIRETVGDPAVDAIDTAYLRAYQDRRLATGAARGTVELETCVIGRGFSIARELGMLRYVPKIPHLRLENARQGFYERADFEAIMRNLDPQWRAFAWAAYHTGWRPSELLSRQWRHVDLDRGWLRLDRGETKNGDPRNTPIVPELGALLSAHKALCEACERAVGCVVPWVFFDPRSGRRLRSYARPWHHACTAAGFGHRIMYDLRRTRVRSLERAGVPRIAAMQGWTGHRDYRSWQRYGISDEALLLESAAKVETFEAREAAQPATVQRLSAEKK